MQRILLSDILIPNNNTRLATARFCHPRTSERRREDCTIDPVRDTKCPFSKFFICRFGDKCAYLRTSQSSDVCPICLEIVPSRESPVIGTLPGCGHRFCSYCITKWRTQPNLNRDQLASCPVCRGNSPFVLFTLTSSRPGR